MNQKQQQLSPKDWQQLSEYLDGQLSSRDQNRLEQRLRERADLREGLEELRQTRVLLRSVRMQRAPRNFTLTPAMVRQSRPSIWRELVPVLNFASAMAALALVAILALQLLPGALPAATSREAGAQPTTAAAAPAAAPLLAQDTGQPGTGGTPAVVVQWNGNPAINQPQVTGRGGGGGGSGQGQSGNLEAPPVTVPGFAIPQPGDTAQPNPAEKSFAAPQGATPAAPSSETGLAPAPTETPAAGAPLANPTVESPAPTENPTTEAPAAAAPAPAATSAPAQGALPNQPAPQGTAVASAPISGGGPILGAKPPQQAQAENDVQLQSQQRDLAQDQGQRQAKEQPRGTSFPWEFPAALAVIAIGAAVASILIRRRSKA